jgi:AbrB family looped-hinge helix DNA binding protein
VDEILSPKKTNGDLTRKSRSSTSSLDFSFPDFPENEGLISKKIRIDSKGRISIPSELRKNFGLEEGSEIELLFDLRKNFVVLVFGEGSDSYGQDGVKGKDAAELRRPTKVSTEACGASRPGSNTAFPTAPAYSKAVEQKGNPVEIPGLGPEERRTYLKLISKSKEVIKNDINMYGWFGSW